MASITQTIPSFTGGISQQPDELMLPGQVKDLLNCVPDITDGLVRRNGSRYLATLSGATSTGSWFSYYRDKAEGAYIGQVQLNGTVNMWKASDGSSIVVHNPTGVSVQPTGYLNHQEGDMKFLSAGDTTFLTNTEKKVAMTSAVSPSRPYAHEAFIELRKLEHGREYSFSVSNVGSAETQVGAVNTGRAVELEVDLPGAGTPPNGFRSIARGNAQTGIDPSLEHQASEIFNVSSGSGKNLTFRLTTTGQVAVQSNTGGGSVDANDYVGVYNTNVELLSGGWGWAADPNHGTNTVQVEMRGVNYTVRVKNIQAIFMAKDRGFFRPAPTSYDAAMDISADTLLGQITPGTAPFDGLEIDMTNPNVSNDNGVIKKIGNGIYFASNRPFQIHTRQPDLWKITNMETNSVNDLPRSCRNGFIVKVLNSGESALDDFYLKFVGDGGDGAGRWEETTGFGIKTTLDGTTLPKTLQRKQADSTTNISGVNNGDIYFELNTPPWVTRQVGDDDTNPLPEIVGRKISQTFLHRNRLGFLTEDKVVLSQAGSSDNSLYNFFQDSALVIGASDPINIAASSTQPTKFIDCIETNTGLVIFAETQQFMLHTDSDTLTPETGKLTNISTYRYSPLARPVSLGTTIAFADSAGVNTRFMEMFDIRREGEPQVIEQTKVVPTLLPQDLDIVINSRENNTIFFIKSGTKDIYGYRYFNTDSKRVQSAWFRWAIGNDIAYAFVLDDALLLISENNKLIEINLQKKDDTRLVNGRDFNGNDTTYSSHLDSTEIVTAGSYSSSTDLTTVTWTNATGIANPPPATIFAINPTTGVVHRAHSVNGGTVLFNGNISGQSLIIGRTINTRIDLPKLYVKKKAGETTVADTSASLTIQRVNLNFGDFTELGVEVFKRGRPTTGRVFQGTDNDWYEESSAPFISEKTVSVPVYERNINSRLRISVAAPGPVSLRSLTWEGNYTPMYHQRV
tara:strand:- start:241 stop:3132 length:2892 start_codon:yes stop_codon:yes gene_type:complete